jgi:uncharacterized membrane protein YfcA
MVTTLALIFLTAIVAGAFGGMLGIGGSLILVPVITLFLDVPMKTAIGASIVSIIGTSSAAQIVYVRRRLTNTRLGVAVELVMVFGAVAGALVGVLISPSVLQGLFGAILLWAAWSMSRGGRESDHDPACGILRCTYRDESSGQAVSYGVQRLRLGLGMTFVGGNLSGLLGLGGGVVTVPVTSLVMRVPLKAAIATSNFAIGATAAASAVIYFGHGFMDPRVAAPAALGILIGALIGPRVGSRLSSRALRIIFTVVQVVFAGQMIWKAFT